MNHTREDAVAQGWVNSPENESGPEGPLSLRMSKGQATESILTLGDFSSSGDDFETPDHVRLGSMTRKFRKKRKNFCNEGVFEKLL